MTAATPEAHVIVVKPASEYRTRSYGVTWESVFVYRTSRSSSPTRVVVWDNSHRPADTWLDGRFLEEADRHGLAVGQYVDPNNRLTDDQFTILLSPEASSIDAYGTGTGTPGSGQVWSQQEDGVEVIHDGDLVTLAYFNPDWTHRSQLKVEEFVAVLPRYSNGHGRLEPAS